MAILRRTGRESPPGILTVGTKLNLQPDGPPNHPRARLASALRQAFPDRAAQLESALATSRLPVGLDRDALLALAARALAADPRREQLLRELERRSKWFGV